MSRFSPFKDTLRFAAAVPALSMTELEGCVAADVCVVCRGIAVVDRGAKIRLCRFDKYDFSAQVVGQFGSAGEFSNGGVSAAPVGVDDPARTGK